MAPLWAEIVPLLGNGSNAWGFGREYPFAGQLQSDISHRITLRPEAEIEGATPARVLASLVEATPVPR